MALRGQHEHNLDAKDRLTIPASHRAGLAGGVVAMAGVEPCVELWPREAAERMEESFLNPLNQMGEDARRLRRRFFGSSEEGELDAAGRIRLPSHLIDHASLSGGCLVVGVGDHLEIWNRSAWGTESEQVNSSTKELTEKLADRFPSAEAAS
ncbi:MAG: division/cell wall cluster transcriptional repressor MraZ [Solirubrobacterales bacterium]